MVKVNYTKVVYSNAKSVVLFYFSCTTLPLLKVSSNLSLYIVNPTTFTIHDLVYQPR